MSIKMGLPHETNNLERIETLPAEPGAAGEPATAG